MAAKSPQAVEIPKLMAYRPAAAARLLSMSRATLWRRIASGKLRAKRDDGCTVIAHTEIERYLSDLPDAA